MALTAERLAALKLYCRIDEDMDAEDALLTGLYEDAVSYLEDAGIGEPPEGTPRRAKFDLCVDALVLDSYDNRGATLPRMSTVADNPAFRRRLNQLKLTEPAPSVSDSDTVKMEG